MVTKYCARSKDQKSESEQGQQKDIWKLQNRTSLDSPALIPRQFPFIN